MALVNPSKEIKTKLGRAKVYLNKHQIMKCVAEVLPAIKMHIMSQKQIVGPERIEIEYTLGELCNSLNVVPELKNYLDKPLSYAKGKERATYMRLSRVVKRVLEDMEKGKDDTAEQEMLERKRRDDLLSKLDDFLANKDVIRAGGAIKKLLDESGNDARVIMKVAETYYKHGDYKTVAEYAVKAIQHDPQHMRAYKLGVNAFRFLKQYDNAEKLYKRAIKAFGHHPNIYANLIKLYDEWGKDQKAVECARMTLKLDPENEDAKMFLAGKGVDMPDVSPVSEASDEAPPSDETQSPADDQGESAPENG